MMNEKKLKSRLLSKNVHHAPGTVEGNNNIKNRSVFDLDSSDDQEDNVNILPIYNNMGFRLMDIIVYSFIYKVKH